MYLRDEQDGNTILGGNTMTKLTANNMGTLSQIMNYTAKNNIKCNFVSGYTVEVDHGMVSIIKHKFKGMVK